MQCLSGKWGWMLLPLSTRPTLDQFVQKADGRFCQNAYVSYPGFRQLYIRVTKRVIAGQMRVTIDLANLVADQPGNGAFTDLLGHLQANYPSFGIFVECVQSDRFQQGLLKRGFVEVEGHPACFWMDPKERL
jgi:hypothetical protein